MHEVFTTMISTSIGVLFGLLYYASLWWTARAMLKARRFSFWVWGGRILRTLLVLTGFYAVGNGDWKRLFACVLGFIIGRILVTWWINPMGSTQRPFLGEGRHAPQS